MLVSSHFTPFFWVLVFALAASYAGPSKLLSQKVHQWSIIEILNMWKEMWFINLPHRWKLSWWEIRNTVQSKITQETTVYQNADSLTLACFSCRSRLLFSRYAFDHVWVWHSSLLKCIVYRLACHLTTIPPGTSRAWPWTPRFTLAMSWHHGAGSSQRRKTSAMAGGPFQTTPPEILLAYHPSTTYVCPYPCRRPLGSLGLLSTTCSFMLQILQDAMFNPIFK